MMSARLAIPARKTEVEKCKITHPDVTENLYVKSKTLKCFYNLRDKDLSDDTKKQNSNLKTGYIRVHQNENCLY